MDRLKQVILAAVQDELGRVTFIDELTDKVRQVEGHGYIEHSDLAASETMLRVTGASGPARYFRVKVSEVL